VRAAARRLTWPLLISLPVLALAVADARSEVTESGNLVVDFHGGIRPRALPRRGAAPVRVHLSATVSTTDGARLPQLDQVVLEINRFGRLDAAGLPACRPSQLVAATTRGALGACRRALVGRGHVSAKISLPEQAPLPSEGELLAFNGRRHGHPVIYGHVYGDVPLPVTSIVRFRIEPESGRFGTRLVASFPHVAADWGYVTAFQFELGRLYRAGGRERSYLEAGCPAPRHLRRALFTLARATYSFEDGRTLRSSLVRSCKVRGRG
jgi:hypothetical protein